MNKVNELVICKKEFESEDKFKSRLRDAIIVLVNSGYICTVREDEAGIIAIDYEHADQRYGSPYPYWLTPEQWESIPLDDGSDNSE